MFGLGYQELLLILVIVLILFGANRLPELARSLGSSVKEFKKGVTEASKDESTAAAKKEDEKKAQLPRPRSTSFPAARARRGVVDADGARAPLSDGSSRACSCRVASSSSAPCSVSDGVPSAAPAPRSSLKAAAC